MRIIGKTFPLRLIALIISLGSFASNTQAHCNFVLDPITNQPSALHPTDSTKIKELETQFTALESYWLSKPLKESELSSAEISHFFQKFTQEGHQLALAYANLLERYGIPTVVEKSYIYSLDINQQSYPVEVYKTYLDFSAPYLIKNKIGRALFDEAERYHYTTGQHMAFYLSPAENLARYNDSVFDPIRSEVRFDFHIVPQLLTEQKIMSNILHEIDHAYLLREPQSPLNLDFRVNGTNERNLRYTYYALYMSGQENLTWAREYSYGGRDPAFIHKLIELLKNGLMRTDDYLHYLAETPEEQIIQNLEKKGAYFLFFIGDFRGAKAEFARLPSYPGIDHLDPLQRADARKIIATFKSHLLLLDQGIRQSLEVAEAGKPIFETITDLSREEQETFYQRFGEQVQAPLAALIYGHSPKK